MYQECVIKLILLLACMHLGFGKKTPLIPLHLVNFIGCITDTLQQDYFL